jgi:hypothetical protein
MPYTPEQTERLQAALRDKKSPIPKQVRNAMRESIGLSVMMNDLRNKDLSDYGESKDKIGTDDPMYKKLKLYSEQGLGKDYIAGQMQIQGDQLRGGLSSSLRGLRGNMSSSGLGGGLGSIAEQDINVNYQRQYAGAENVVMERNDAAKLNAMQELLGIEQFNKQQDLAYRTAMSSKDIALANMKLQEVLTNRQIRAQENAAARSSFMGLLGDAALFIALV